MYDKEGQFLYSIVLGVLNEHSSKISTDSKFVDIRSILRNLNQTKRTTFCTFTSKVEVFSGIQLSLK